MFEGIFEGVIGLAGELVAMLTPTPRIPVRGDQLRAKRELTLAGRDLRPSDPRGFLIRLPPGAIVRVEALDSSSVWLTPIVPQTLEQLDNDERLSAHAYGILLEAPLSTLLDCFDAVRQRGAAKRPRAIRPSRPDI